MKQFDHAIRWVNNFLSSPIGVGSIGMLFIVFTCVFYGFSQASDGKAGHIANAIGIVSAIFAFLASGLNFWNSAYESKIREQLIPIRIVSVYSRKSQELPMPITRGSISRSEVQGYLGLIPRHDSASTGYRLSYLATPHFFRQMVDIEGGNKNTLEIFCTEEEFHQFDFDGLYKKITQATEILMDSRETVQS